VFEDNLEAHVGKCPFRKHADALAAQPYYSKGVNSGGGGAAVSSAAKRAAVHKLSEEGFWGLVAKIRSAHAAAAAQMRESHVAPDACEKWMKGQVDRWVRCRFETTAVIFLDCLVSVRD
jgi:tRNA:m4X modification enzyme